MTHSVIAEHHRSDTAAVPGASAPVSTGTRLLIYNPNAGNRIRMSQLSAICRLFADRGWPVIPHPTRGPRMAADVVREYSADIDGVIVLGGDGTLNEVLPAVVGTPLFVAIMPGGTANVLAHELQLPLRLNRAVDGLTGGHIRAVNVGRANDRHFLAMAGAGFDARIVEAMPAHLKSRLGRLAFVLEAMRQLRRYDFTAIRFCTDDDRWEAPLARVQHPLLRRRLYPGARSLAGRADAGPGHLFRSRRLAAYLRYLYHLTRRTHTHLCPMSSIARYVE